MKYLLSIIAIFIVFSINAQQELELVTVPETLETTPVGLFGGGNNNYTEVNLPAGRTIVLETTEEIPSDYMTRGQNINFRVRNNVVINGLTVIRTGAMAIGVVEEKYSTGSYNDPERIKIRVNYVTAVDNQQILTDPDSQTFSAVMSGQGFSVYPQKVITARIANNTVISCRE